MVKAVTLNRKDFLQSNFASKQKALELIKQAMQHANESNDECLLAFVSDAYFSIAVFYNELELSVIYATYSIELHEKYFGVTELNQYHFVAEIM